MEEVSKMPDPLIPDPREQDADGLNSYQRIFIFVLMVLLAVGADAVAIWRGHITSYDTEAWYAAMKISGVFLLIFRPATFATVLGRVMDLIPGLGKSKGS